MHRPDAPHGKQWIEWRIGVREKSPARRIRPFLLYGVPALNALAIAALVALAADRIAISPSIAFSLPGAEFSSGAQAALSAAMIVPQDSKAILFFDGVRYRLDDDSESAAFSAALVGAMRDSGRSEISLFADGAAPHDQIMRFAAAARRAGASAVNIAVREEP